MPLLVLMRHGQSMWNKKPSNPEKAWKYAGSVDIPLSHKGITQAMQAGDSLKNIPLDVVYCSMLIRAQTTALIALAAHNSQQAPIVVRDTESTEWRGLRAHTRKMHSGSHSDVIPMYCSYQLNERDFGDIQGMYSSEQQEHYSREKLDSYRCEYDTPFPEGESSHEVYDRAIAFFTRHILPQLKSGKNVLIVCHGFVIRALLKYAKNLSDGEWETEMYKETRHEPSALSVPNAEPVLFSFVSNHQKEGDYMLVPSKLEDLVSLPSSPSVPDTETLLVPSATTSIQSKL